MKRTDRKSHCPVNFALETVGDPWSLLVVRDIVFHGKHAFGEFLASEERITTSVLADRLATLVRTGILAKRRSATDRRKESYSLTVMEGATSRTYNVWLKTDSIVSAGSSPRPRSTAAAACLRGCRR